MKVKGDRLNLDQKRLLAFHEVKEHPSFRDVANILTCGGVHQKFTRMMSSVISKYALDGEGANLSGLPENAPRVETVLYKMVEEKFQNTVRLSMKQKRKADRSERLQSLQDELLQSMVRSNPLKPTNTPSSRQPSQASIPEPQARVELSLNLPPSMGENSMLPHPSISPGCHSLESQGLSSLTSGVITPSSSCATSSVGETSIVTTTEQKWLALMEKREARRNQLQAAQSCEQNSFHKALMDLEDRRLRMEEQRLKLEDQKIQVDLKLEEQRIKVDVMNTENNRRLFDILAGHIGGATTNTNSS